MTTLANMARALAGQASSAVLSSLSDDGTPYGSVVEIAAADNGDIIMLLSQLAEHRSYLQRNARASVLIAPSLHTREVLSQPRVTLLGRAIQTDSDTTIQHIYLERHPNAAQYLSLGDFHFFRLHVEQVRYIAGFGHMGWIEAAEYRGEG